jgi:hypothetical protein
MRSVPYATGGYSLYPDGISYVYAKGILAGLLRNERLHPMPVR